MLVSQMSRQPQIMITQNGRVKGATDFDSPMLGSDGPTITGTCWALPWDVGVLVEIGYWVKLVPPFTIWVPWLAPGALELHSPVRSKSGTGARQS